VGEIRSIAREAMPDGHAQPRRLRALELHNSVQAEKQLIRRSP